jgi:glycosyltransferase involved in cell wall biosynthesis
VERGHHVVVLTGLPNYPTGVIPASYRGKVFLREKQAGMDIVRAWVYATPNKGFVRRLLNHLSLTITAIPASLTLGRVDAILVESPPLFLGMAGYVISRLKRAPYIFNVADLWPETAVALDVLKNRLLIRMAEQLEWFLYKKSARVTTVTRGIRRMLVKRGLPEEKVILLTNGVDTAYFHPDVDPSPARNRLGLDQRVTVTYAGTHGMAQGLEVMVEAAHRLREMEEVGFVMVGEGAEKENLVNLAREYELNNLNFFPNQPKSFMPHLWAATDIAVVTLRDLEIFRSALPSKLFEIMAMERPIVLAAEGEAAHLIRRAGAGIVVEPENPDDLAAAIRQLANDREERRCLGQNGRRYVEAHFSREYLTTILEETIEEIA